MAQPVLRKMAGRHLFACLTLAAALAAQAPARITRAVNLSQTVRLPGNVPAQLRGAVDRGAAPPDLQLSHMLLVLRRSPAQNDALKQFLDAQREQDSGSYHDWLTPSEFGRRFGPAPGDIAVVTNWLTNAGFQVERVAAGEGVIQFSGDAAAVERAFHTTIHRYQVGGALHWANATNPAIPAALAPVVAGVVSMNDFRAPPMAQTARMAQGPIINPDFNFTVNGVVKHALIPGDLATIYDLKPLLSGTSGTTSGAGETIALVARADVNLNDLNSFRYLFLNSGLSNAVTIVPVGGSTGDTDQGDESEATLDSEWAGAAAPGANIDLVVSGGTNSTDGIVLAAEYIVDNDLAPIMSTSFGGCESNFGAAGNQFWNDLWQQAAAEGITAFVASGDQGPATCDALSGTEASHGLAVNGIASTPYDTAVGGTEFNDTSDPGAYWDSTVTGTNPSALSYIPEAGWSEDDPASGNTPEQWGAGGGGLSQIYAKPVWQTGDGVSSAQIQRSIPDVAFNAAGHDGYVVCWQSSCSGTGASFYLFSGTSASSPVMAGVMALVDQAEGGRQGLINPELYRLGAADAANGCTGGSASGANCVFHDVTVGNDNVPCVAGSTDCGAPTVAWPTCSTCGTLGYGAGPGYDFATGLGSIDVANLVAQWNSITFAKSTTTFQFGSSVNPQQLTVGQSVPISLTVTGASGGPTPTGEVVLMAQTSSTTTVLGTFTLDGSGSVNASTTALPAGSYNLVARYGGDTNYGASTAAPAAVSVAKGTATINVGVFTTDASNNLTPVTEAPYGTPIVIKVTVSGSTTTPTGMINVTDNGGPADPVTETFNLNGGAVTLPPITDLPTGLNQIVVKYAGDGNYQSGSATVSLTLDKLATTLKISGYTDQAVTVDLIPSGALAGSNYCFDNYQPVDVSLDNNGALVNTGFTTETTVNGEVVCQAQVIIRQSIPGLAVTLTASFAGSSALLPSTSAPVTIPTPPNLVITPATLDFGTVVVGTSKTLNATLTNQGGQDATHLSFEDHTGLFAEKDDCGGILAAGASCALSFTYTETSQWATSSDSIQVFDGYVQGTSVSLSATNATYQVRSSGSTDFSISAGQTATVPLAVTPINGYQGSVTFSCSNLPVLTTCAFTPSATVSLDGRDPVTLTATISTTAPPAAAATGWPTPRGGGPLWALAWVLGLGVYLASATRRRGMAVTAGALALAIALASCGGGGPVVSTFVPPSGSGGSTGTSGPGGAGGSGGGTTTPTHALAISPSSLNFGTVGTGLVSGSQTVTVTNTGTGSTAGLLAAINPDNLQFQVSSHACASGLAPGKSCSVGVVYSPIWPGASTSTLMVWDGTDEVQAALTGQSQYVFTPANNYSIIINAAPGSTANPNAPLGVVVSLTVK